MRSVSVFVPRSTSHESNGLRIAPAAFWMNLQPLDVLVARGDDDAADRVAVAVEVFRRAVHDQIGAELDRPLQAGTGEGVVDDHERAVLVRRCRDRGDVREPQHRIGGRLEKDAASSSA